jgi:hypothetical protein
MEALHAYLWNHDDSIDLNALASEIHAEWERTTAKSRANATLYDAAHDVAMEIFNDTPMTTSDAFEAGEWPEGFSLSKLRYAVREMWSDELEKHENGKNPLTYTKKSAD